MLRVFEISGISLLGGAIVRRALIFLTKLSLLGIVQFIILSSALGHNSFV